MFLSAESRDLPDNDVRLISREEHSLVREYRLRDPKPCLLVERGVLLDDLDVVPVFGFHRLSKSLLIRHRLNDEDDPRTVDRERLVEDNDRIADLVEVEPLVYKVLEYESLVAVPLAVLLVQDRDNSGIVGIVVLGDGEVYADNDESLVEIAVAVPRAGR